jgi:hypothetical protein
MSDQLPAPTPVVPAYTPPVNALAIVALVLSFVVSIGGIVCGHLALSQIKRTGESGREMALAGLIIGYVFTGIAVLAFLAWIVVFVVYLVFFGVLLTTTGVSSA